MKHRVAKLWKYRFWRLRGALLAALDSAAPSFDLPLLTTLVPVSSSGSGTATFTRATTAYVTDFEGLLKEVPSGCARFQGARFVENFATRNTEVLTAGGGWVLSNATTVGGVADPAGGTSAYTLTALAGSGFIYNNDPIVSAAIGGSRVGTIWIRRRTGTGAINFQVGGSSAVAITGFVTSSWQRVSSGVLTTGAAAAEKRLLIQLATSGDAVDIWRPQGEIVTGQANQNPSEYVSVGVLSAPYHGAGVDGVKYFSTTNGNTVASNVVTEATGAAISSATLLGYLAEGARTNLLAWSNGQAANWTATVGSITDNAAVFADGTTTMRKYTASAVGSIEHGTYPTSPPVTSAGTTYTASIYISAGTNRYLQISFGVNANAVAVMVDTQTWAIVTTGASGTSTYTSSSLTLINNGIYRVTVTGVTQSVQGYVGVTSSANTTLAFPNTSAAANLTFFYSGAQLEAASFASTYIPTTTVAVTRNADVLTYASAGNIDWAAEHTQFAEAQYYNHYGSFVGQTIIASNVAYDGFLRATTSQDDGATNYFNDIAASVSASLAGTDAARQGIVNKYVGRRNVDGTLDVFVAGAKGTTSGVAGSVGGVVSGIQVGCLAADFHLYGTIRNVRIYPRTLSDAKLISMTAS